MITTTSSTIYPWDPTTGCMACCSGEPFPTEPIYTVSRTSL